MGIIKQTIICILIGLIFLGGKAVDNKYIGSVANKAETAICKDYTMKEVKETCLNTAASVKDLTERTKKAIEYTEETMANYRKNVI
ncbi:MAG: hypothetical protein E7222_04435 [Clostridiales bacterium]|uniref:hypothetical protein n=1 Tax=Aminipila sp. TaxID=2060095 RepID=UPI001DC70060|nr:hypothetical protein [Aminipila sp.]MBE6033930.1 hypothetical protein [Clostridiales bacterium]